MFISSILVKRNFPVNAIIRRVNDKLQELCEQFNFKYISNDEVSREFLCEENDDGVDILVKNFVNNVNDLYDVFNRENLD